MLRLQLFHLHSHQQTKEEAKDVKFPFKKLLEIVHNTFIEEKHTIIFDIQVIPHQCWIALYSICNISLVNNRHFLQIFFFLLTWWWSWYRAIHNACNACILKLFIEAMQPVRKVRKILKVHKEGKKNIHQEFYSAKKNDKYQ